MQENYAESFSESVFIDYFKAQSKKIKPKSLSQVHARLKYTMMVKHSLDLSCFSKLTRVLARLKNKKSKTVPKPKTTPTSKVFTKAEVKKFLKQAPDADFLVAKVVLIFGISGACHSFELMNLTVNDVEVQNDVIKVTVRDNNTNKKHKTSDRIFVVDESTEIVYKYMAKRPSTAYTNRFFIKHYQKKGLAIERETMAAMPKEIATYLKLPNPSQYTGQCFRLSSLNIQANSDAKNTF